MICWCIDLDQLWQKFCATSATLMESLTGPNLTKATMIFMRKQKPTPVALSAGSGGQDETVMFRNWSPHGSSGSSHHQFVIPARLQVGVLSGSGDCNCSRFFSGEERNARFRKCAGTCWNRIESGMKVFSMASLETRTALLVTVHLDMSMKHGCNSHELGSRNRVTEVQCPLNHFFDPFEFWSNKYELRIHSELLQLVSHALLVFTSLGRIISRASGQHGFIKWRLWLLPKGYFCDLRLYCLPSWAVYRSVCNCSLVAKVLTGNEKKLCKTCGWKIYT